METYQIADATKEAGEDSYYEDDVLLEFDTREAAEEKIAELDDEKFSVKVVYPQTNPQSDEPVADESDDTDGGV